MEWFEMKYQTISTIQVQLQGMSYSLFLQFWNPWKWHTGNCKLSFSEALVIISAPTTKRCISLQYTLVSPFVLYSILIQNLKVHIVLLLTKTYKTDTNNIKHPNLILPQTERWKISSYLKILWCFFGGFFNSFRVISKFQLFMKNVVKFCFRYLILYGKRNLSFFRRKSAALY